jgi:hypothetical protein
MLLCRLIRIWREERKEGKGEGGYAWGEISVSAPRHCGVNLPNEFITYETISLSFMFSFNSSFCFFLFSYLCVNHIVNLFAGASVSIVSTA